MRTKSLKKNKINVITLGCSKNTYDSEVLMGQLKANGKDVTKDLGYVGHRDFSIDKNKNGVIESFERNKECPSFDIIGSVEHFLYSSADRFNKLPTQK